MNGDATAALLTELKELSKSEEIPPRVSNRMVLTGLILLFEKVEQNNKLKGRVSRLEGISALLTALVLTLIGIVAKTLELI